MKTLKKGDKGFLEYCISEGLPYIEEDGKLRNTWRFSERGETFLKEGRYSGFAIGSKAHMDFWMEEMRRCTHGYELGGVRITGYNYFFLNYYPMDIAESSGDISDVARGFPAFMKAQYDFFNVVEYCERNGLNLSLIKPRGVGLSEAAASMGARDFCIIVEDSKGNRKFRTDIYFARGEEHLFGSGVVDKCMKAISFCADYTEDAFYHDTSGKNSHDHKIAGYMDLQRNIKRTGGEIIGQVVKKADNVRGKRGYKIFWEESGANDILNESLVVGLPLTRRAGSVTGVHIIWGTSNADDKGVDAFQKVLYNPSAFDCVKFRNVWEDQDGRPKHPKDVPYNILECVIPQDSEEEGVGMFIPAYDADRKFCDSDGNPDREKAWEFYNKERLKRERGLGEGDLAIYKGDYPFSLSEALFKKGSSFFNKSKLTMQKQDLEIHKRYPLPETGFLEWKKSEGKIVGVEWRKHPQGNIHIVEHPLKSYDGKPYDNLYIGGIDSIDKGILNSQVGEKGSEFCILLKKRMFGTTGDIYVAYYKERPDLEESAYDNAAKLLWYYGAKANLEDTKTNIVTYFRSKSLTHLLYHQPRLARADKVSRKQVARYGTPAHEKYVYHGLELVKRYVENSYQEIYFPELVNQLLEYDYAKKRKFDMVASMQMCEIGDEDMKEVREDNVKSGGKMKFGYYKDERGIKRYGALKEDSSKMIRHSSTKSANFIGRNGEINYDI